MENKDNLVVSEWISTLDGLHVPLSEHEHAINEMAGWTMIKEMHVNNLWYYWWKRQIGKEGK